MSSLTLTLQDTGHSVLMKTLVCVCGHPGHAWKLGNPCLVVVMVMEHPSQGALPLHTLLVPQRQVKTE